MNRKEDIELLAKEASTFVRIKTWGQMETCTFFYRDISQDSYNYVFEKRDETMEKYEKDCDGDPANPINGQISGVSFSTSMENYSERCLVQKNARCYTNWNTTKSFIK